MLATFFILFTFSQKEDDLAEFNNKDIKIYFSGYPTTQLGLYKDSKNLVAISKYVNFESRNFSPKARLIKNGNQYELFFSGKRMCKNKKIVSVCDIVFKWKIVPKVFGFNIQTDNKCITKGQEDSIVLSSCTESDDQLFNFKKICEDCDVKDDTEKHSVHINFLPDNVSRFTVTDHDNLGGEKNNQKNVDLTGNHVDYIKAKEVKNLNDENLDSQKDIDYVSNNKKDNPSSSNLSRGLLNENTLNQHTSTGNKSNIDLHHSTLNNDNLNNFKSGKNDVHTYNLDEEVMDE